MATRDEYIINKEVSVLLTNGEKVVTGHLRSKDGKVIYFNPVRGVGQQWIDSLNDSVESSAEEVKLQFA